jgi:predicted amidohydrolase
MGRTIKVAAAQTGPVLTDDIAPGVESACAMIEQAAGQGVDIICFPEVFLSPFFPNRLTQDYEKFFISLPDVRTEPLFRLARDRRIAMIFAFAEHTGSYFYNSAWVFDHAGRHVGTYRKTHIPAYFPSELRGGTGSYEKLYFAAGNALPVFELDGMRFGIQICNDRLYPEPSRVLALNGAEVIFMPIAYATYGNDQYRVAIWDLPLQARAFDNGVFVVAANRVGDENGRLHIGKSTIVHPLGGRIVRQAGMEAPELLVAEIDLDDVANARRSLPWWRDRRPELYRDIATPPVPAATTERATRR